MLLTVVDFEATGLRPGAAICQVRHCDVRIIDDKPEVGDAQVAAS